MLSRRQFLAGISAVALMPHAKAFVRGAAYSSPPPATMGKSVLNISPLGAGADFPFANMMKMASGGGYTGTDNTNIVGILDANGYPNGDPSGTIFTANNIGFLVPFINDNPAVATQYWEIGWTGKGQFDISDTNITIISNSNANVLGHSAGYTGVVSPDPLFLWNVNTSLPVKVVFYWPSNPPSVATCYFPRANFAGYSGMNNLYICRAGGPLGTEPDDRAAVYANLNALNPDFVAKVKDWKPLAIRFMDAMWTNFQIGSLYSTKTPPGYVYFADGSFVLGCYAGQASGTDTYAVSNPTNSGTGAYADGETVQFQVINSNLTRTPTLNVGGRGAAPMTNVFTLPNGLLQFEGTPTAGDTYFIDFTATSANYVSPWTNGTTETVSYTCSSGDTGDTVMTSLYNQINSNAGLTANNLNGRLFGSVSGSTNNMQGAKIFVVYNSPIGAPTIASRTSVGATGKINIGTIPQGQFGGSIVISAVADNGSGHPRCTVGSTFALDINKTNTFGAGTQNIVIAGATGFTGINGTFTAAQITIIDDTHFDIPSVAFSSGYVANSANATLTYQNYYTATYDGFFNVWRVQQNGIKGGFPVSVACDLCNQANANGWFNIPQFYNATEAVNYANAIKADLNSSLGAWFEWANEVWNLGFSATSYAWTLGASLNTSGNPGTGNFLLGYAYKFASLMGAIKSAWGSGGPTLKCLIMDQEFGFGSNTRPWQWEAQPLNPGTNAFYALTGLPNYSTAGSRPIDIADGTGYAIYLDGTTLNRVYAGNGGNTANIKCFVGGPSGINYSNGIFGAADDYASGVPAQQANALAWIDWDVHEGMMCDSFCTWSTGTGSGGVCTITAGGASLSVVANAPVMFNAATSVPTGLTAGVTYYAVNVSGSTFQVATTPSGAPLTISNTGTGAQYWGTANSSLSNSIYAQVHGVMATWNTAAAAYSKQVYCYEGGLEIAEASPQDNGAETESWAQALTGLSGYAVKIQNLINAYKTTTNGPGTGNSYGAQAILDLISGFLSLSQSAVPAQYEFFGGSRWSVGNNGLYDASSGTSTGYPSSTQSYPNPWQTYYGWKHYNTVGLP